MSTQPIHITPEVKEAQAKAKAHENQADWLYIAGGILVVVGIALHSIATALIVAGGFCLLCPMLELAAGFIRGLRPAARKN